MIESAGSDEQHSRALPTIPDDDDISDAQSVDSSASEASDSESSDTTETAEDYVMYPKGGISAAHWAGWPVDWATPTSGSWSTKIAERNDVAWNAIDLNSGILATMPAYIQLSSLRLEADDPDAPDWLSNPEPNVYTSWDEFLRQLVWSYWAAGEAFIYCLARDDFGMPLRFVVVHPAFVSITGRSAPFNYAISGAPVASEDVLHIRYSWSPEDTHGSSPLEVAGSRIIAAEMLTRYSAELASNGGLPMTVLSTPKRLSRKQMNQALTDWQIARRSRLGLPAVLSDGMKLETPTAAIKDIALVELERFSESRISNILGVPPFLLGLPSGGDSMTYSNVSSLFDFHWRAHLRPKSQIITKALSNWLLPRGAKLLLDRDDYVRPGWQELTQGFGTLVSAGVLSSQDVRNELGFPGTAPGKQSTISATPGDLPLDTEGIEE